MKYLPLIWTGLWRKRARTIFTFLSILVAFLLFGFLQGIDTSFKQMVDIGRLNYLVTTNPAGLPLPLADLPQIKAVPGVTEVTYRAQLIGYYQTLRNIVIALPLEPVSFFSMNPDFSVPPEQLQSLINTRTGAIISESLSRRLNWKVGDHVPFKAIDGIKKDGSADWTVDIVGIYQLPLSNPVRDESILLMNYEYFDLARATANGTVVAFSEKISDASRSTEIATAIDKLFVNSPHQTRTETEKASVQSALAQLGDLDFFVDAIVGASFFTLLLLTGNTMMQSFRERIRDFAVMKTLGFQDSGIAALVVSEALILSIGGALLGLLIARMLLPTLSNAAGGQMPGVHLPWQILVGGVVVAMLLALLSVLPAAWRANRLQIVDALAAH